ncbi:MAG: hypothetical protein IKU86_10675 [Thermoguttaceae bacterium]|nr:hypothetical protein [Thermoguttaceae bacterium]
MKTPFNEPIDASQERLDDSTSDPYLRPTRSGCLSRLVRTLALLSALVGTGAAVVGFLYWRNVSQPIDVETASPGKLVGWLALRDLSVETPETRERLFERYVETLEDENGVVEPEKLEIPEQAKRFANRFFAKRDDSNATSEKAKTAERLPVMRLDYYVAPRSADSPIASDFVLSDEVRPGPALLERWNASRDAQKNGAVEKTSAVEKNIRLLVMQWFVAKRRDYDAAPDAEKETRLEAIVDELLGWQELYGKIQTDASRTALLAEFEKTVASWNEFEEPEELAKTLWFKDLIVATIAAQETPLGQIAPPKPPRARKLAAEESTRPAARDFGARTLDAARRFFFGTPRAETPSL